MQIDIDVAAVVRRIAELSAAVVPEAPAFAAADADGFSRLLGAAAERARPRERGAVPPERIARLVRAEAAGWNVDPALVTAVIANESGFDPNATSRTGAAGLMQLEPATAASVGVADVYDPAQNVAGGTRYLRGLLDRFHGNVRLALAAYNAGPGAVEKYRDVPPYAETQNYVRSVLASYAEYRALRAGTAAP